MDHRTTCNRASPRSRRILSSLLAASAISFGWSASGTVRSVGGTALSGVEVVQSDSTAHRTTTDATGAFVLESTSGTVVGAYHDKNLSIRVDGAELVVQVPADGPVRLSLIDASGRESWTATAIASDGVARAPMPVGMGRQALWIRVRHALGEFDRPALTGADGLRIATHVAAARSLATFPVLKFSKSGYRDTTHAMTSSSQSNLAIVMRDTGTPAAVCPATKLAAGDQTKTISVNGVSRTYILHVPSAYAGSSAVPLVVDFHPIGGSASGEEGSSPYKAKADADGAITAYPNGLASPNLGQAWNVQGCCTTANDTGFARALVADVEKIACINPKRVYAVGFSMGGGMTHFSACHLADLFAAGAPAAFDLTQQNAPDCKPSRPIAMIIFRSTGDNVVAYAGGHSALVTGMAIDFLGAKATFAKWAALDQCTDTPSTEDANGCSTYSKCAGGVQVTLCTKQGGTHEAGNANVGWPLLKKYTLP